MFCVGVSLIFCMKGVQLKQNISMFFFSASIIFFGEFYRLMTADMPMNLGKVLWLFSDYSSVSLSVSILLHFFYGFKKKISYGGC